MRTFFISLLVVGVLAMAGVGLLGERAMTVPVAAERSPPPPPAGFTNGPFNISSLAPYFNVGYAQCALCGMPKSGTSTLHALFVRYMYLEFGMDHVPYDRVHVHAEHGLRPFGRFIPHFNHLVHPRGWQEQINEFSLSKPSHTVVQTRDFFSTLTSQATNVFHNKTLAEVYQRFQLKEYYVAYLNKMASYGTLFTNIDRFRTVPTCVAEFEHLLSVCKLSVRPTNTRRACDDVLNDPLAGKIRHGLTWEESIGDPLERGRALKYLRQHLHPRAAAAVYPDGIPLT
jgi:hypothetical protein